MLEATFFATSFGKVEINSAKIQIVFVENFYRILLQLGIVLVSNATVNDIPFLKY